MHSRLLAIFLSGAFAYIVQEEDWHWSKQMVILLREKLELFKKKNEI